MTPAAASGDLPRDEHRQTPRRRLLIVASNLDGTDISEGNVAYQWASRLAPRHDLTVLTSHKRGRPSARDQLPGARFVEWRDWPLVDRAQILNNLMQPSYAGFYVQARRWIRRALARGETFDVVHQLTPMALRYPSPAAGLVPRLVLGPMAGALPNPPAFADEMAGEPWYIKLRALDRWRFDHDPVLRRSMASASVIIGAADYVRDVLRNVPVRRFEVMPEHGVAELVAPPTRPSRAPGTLRAVFVGRVIRTKGLRDAIRALARLGDLPDVTLDVAGDGPDRPACEAEAQRLGVAGRVRFHGWLARGDIDTLYGQADAFVFPSFREPSGAVVVEAMSHGLPAIVADYGGPSSLAGPDAAIRVPVRDPDQYATALADAMRALAGDPARRAAMGEAGRRRVADQFLWPAKIRWLEGLYEEVITQS